MDKMISHCGYSCHLSTFIHKSRFNSTISYDIFRSEPIVTLIWNFLNLLVLIQNTLHADNGFCFILP